MEKLFVCSVCKCSEHLSLAEVKGCEAQKVQRYYNVGEIILYTFTIQFGWNGARNVFHGVGKNY